MKKTIKIDSKKYTTIVKSIETSAEDCLLNEKEWLSYRKTKGTDIARYIAKQAKATNKITKAYQNII